MHYRKGKNHLIFDFMAFNNELSYSKLLECLFLNFDENVVRSLIITHNQMNQIKS